MEGIGGEGGTILVGIERDAGAEICEVGVVDS